MSALRCVAWLECSGVCCVVHALEKNAFKTTIPPQLQTHLSSSSLLLAVCTVVIVQVLLPPPHEG